MQHKERTGMQKNQFFSKEYASCEVVKKIIKFLKKEYVDE